jgi:cytidylate kinase
MVLAPVITIDGPSGSGKGTVSQRLARHLGWHLLDSGAIYRILAYAASERGFNLQDGPALVALVSTLPVRFEEGETGVRVLLRGKDVSEVIRTEQCGHQASVLSAIPEVRAALLQWQRDFRKQPGLVTDGRDMGTVVFPDASLKIFLEANPDIRAERRFWQLKDLGQSVNLQSLFLEVVARDERDRNRAISPLQPALDAITIDASFLSKEDVFEKVLRYVQEKGLGG